MALDCGLGERGYGCDVVHDGVVGAVVLLQAGDEVVEFVVLCCVSNGEMVLCIALTSIEWKSKPLLQITPTW